MVPVFSTVPEPFKGERVILPVVAPPIVNVLFLTDWIDPSLDKTRACADTFCAEMLAVGVPEFIFKIANLADVEEVPPIIKSVVSCVGNNPPLWICQKAIVPLGPAIKLPFKYRFLKLRLGVPKSTVFVSSGAT